MNQIKSIITLTLAALTVTACSVSDADLETAGSWTGDIRLGANVLDASRTRAADAIQGKLFDKGEKIAVFVEENTTEGQSAESVTYYDKTLYTVGTVAESDASNSLSTDPLQYYPSSGNSVSIYAFYPCSVTDVRIAEADVPFTVTTNQSDSAGYKASDLMVAVEPRGLRQAAAHELVFSHKLSKVIIKLVAGHGYNDEALTDERRAEMLQRLEGATVEILGVKPTVDLLRDDHDGLTGNIGEAYGTPVDVLVINPTRLNADTTDDAFDYVAGACVLPPQTFDSGSRYLRISLADGGVLNYDLQADETLLPGTAVTYVLTVNLSGITLTSNIVDWDSSTEVRNWDAAMDDI